MESGANRKSKTASVDFYIFPVKQFSQVQKYACPRYLGSSVATPSGPSRTFSTMSRHFHACSGLNISGAWNSNGPLDNQTQNATLMKTNLT